MTESEDIIETSEFNEDEFIDELLAEENEEDESLNPVDNSEEQAKQVNEKSTKFPLARIKTLMKMDPDLSLASQESVFLVAKATELFLMQLAKETFSNTAKAKRKTMQRRDLDLAIENIDALCFLEGALD